MFYVCRYCIFSLLGRYLAIASVMEVQHHLLVNRLQVSFCAILVTSLIGQTSKKYKGKNNNKPVFYSCTSIKVNINNQIRWVWLNIELLGEMVSLRQTSQPKNVTSYDRALDVCCNLTDLVQSQLTSHLNLTMYNSLL